MWGLIIGICIGAIAIGLRVDGKLNEKWFIAMLLIAIGSGLVIAYFGKTKIFKAGLDGFELETFREDVNSVKQEAIDELNTKVEAQKESVNLLTRTANQVNEKLEGTIAQVSDQEKSIASLIESASEAEMKLQAALQMAAPPKLSLLSKEVNKTEQGYSIILKFKPSKLQPLGRVGFAAKIIDDSDSKIIDFWPTGSFGSGKDSKKISDNGKEARLIYNLFGGALPQVKLITSGICKIEISGSHELTPIVLEIN